MRIDSYFLLGIGARQDCRQLARFVALFGPGASDLTAANVRRAAVDGLPVEWFACQYLRAADRARYRDAMTVASVGRYAAVETAYGEGDPRLIDEADRAFERSAAEALIHVLSLD